MPQPVKQEVKKRGIGVEMCLSCNVNAKMLPNDGGFEEHHFREWWEESKGGGATLALCVSSLLNLLKKLAERRVSAFFFRSAC